MTRYDDLLDALPQTPEWKPKGDILPFRGDLPTDLQFDPGAASTRFLVYDNGVPAGEVITDIQGNAIVSLVLDAGVHEILLLDPVGGTRFRTAVDVRHLATLVSAAADSLEDVDADLAAARAALELEEVDAGYINERYGRTVSEGNSMEYSLAAYRALLFSLRQGYRHLAGRVAGPPSSVVPLLSTDPLVLPRVWRPTWVLGHGLLAQDAVARQTRSAAPQYQDAGVDFPTLNALSLRFVHAGHPANDTLEFTDVILPLPKPQRLTVTFEAGWDGGDVTVEGLAPSGATITETFPAAPGTTVSGASIFVSVTEISHDVVGASTDEARVGLADDRFVRLRHPDRPPVVAGPYAATGATVFNGPVRQPDFAQRLAVDFTLDWDGGDIILMGSDFEGALVSETFSPTTGGGGLVIGETFFASITSPVRSDTGTTGYATVRCTEPARSSPIGADLRLAATNLYRLTGPSRLRLGTDGLEVATPASGVYTVKSDPTPAVIVGRVDDSGFDTSSMDRLELDIDDLGPITVTLATGAPTPTAAEVAGDVNAALNADGRYGAAYATFADDFLSAGYLQLRDLAAPAVTGAASRIRVLPHPVDAAPSVLGTPLHSARTAGTVAEGSTTIVCASSSNLPAPQTLYQTDTGVEVGTGTEVAATLTGLIYDPLRHLGASVQLVGMTTPANDGRHTIVDGAEGTETVTLAHESGSFTAETVGGADWTMFGQNTYQVRVGRLERDSGTSVNVAQDGVFESAVALVGYTYRAANDLGGYVRLDGLPAVDNEGLHLIVDGDEGTSTVVLRHELYAQNVSWSVESEPAATWIVYGRGHMVEVIQNDRGADTLVLAEPGLLAALPADGLVELDELVVEANGTDGIGTLELEVDDRWGLGASNDPIAPAGTYLPTSWTAVNDPTLDRSTDGLYTQSRLVVIPDGVTEPSVEFEIPGALDFVGWTVRVSTWLQQTDNGGAPQDAVLEHSFDGATFTPGTPVTLASLPYDDTNRVGPFGPSLLSEDITIPRTATTLRIRITYDTVDSNDRLLLEAVEVVALAAPDFTVPIPLQGSSLGLGTVPRTPQFEQFGEVLLAWTRYDPEDPVWLTLGFPLDGAPLPDPGAEGHIDRLGSAVSVYERFDVTDGVNLVGCYTENEWAAAAMTNMTLIGTAPVETSYVQPLMRSLVTRERLNLIAPTNAILTLDSIHEGSFPEEPSGLDLLRELDSPGIDLTGVIDGLPLQQTGTPLPWRWVAANEVQIDASYFNAESSYDLDYEALIRAETGVLDLSIDFGDYLWLIDVAAFIRRVPGIQTRVTTEVLDVFEDYTARLSTLSTGDRTTTVIVQDTGVLQTTLTREDWTYLDDRTVQISPAAFDPDAVYTITYEAEYLRLTRPVSYRIDWRTAATLGGVSAAPYVEAVRNEAVAPLEQYNQLRITWYGIEDPRDVRLYGLGLKGLHLFGPDAVAPGIIIPG